MDVEEVDILQGGDTVRQEAVMAHHEEACEAHHLQAGTEAEEGKCVLHPGRDPDLWDAVCHRLDTIVTPTPQACHRTRTPCHMVLGEYLRLCRLVCPLAKPLR